MISSPAYHTHIVAHMQPMLTGLRCSLLLTCLSATQSSKACPSTFFNISLRASSSPTLPSVRVVLILRVAPCHSILTGMMRHCPQPQLITWGMILHPLLPLLNMLLTNSSIKAMLGLLPHLIRPASQSLYYLLNSSRSMVSMLCMCRKAMRVLCLSQACS